MQAFKWSIVSTFNKTLCWLCYRYHLLLSGPSLVHLHHRRRRLPILRNTWHHSGLPQGIHFEGKTGKNTNKRLWWTQLSMRFAAIKGMNCILHSIIISNTGSNPRHFKTEWCYWGRTKKYWSTVDYWCAGADTTTCAICKFHCFPSLNINWLQTAEQTFYWVI